MDALQRTQELLEKMSNDNETKKLPMPTSLSDFKVLIDNQYAYIDKTLFAKEILDSSESVILLTRPRRWGKTLAMSMLNYFLRLEVDENGNPVENNSNKSLFENLEIAKTFQASSPDDDKLDMIKETIDLEADKYIENYKNILHRRQRRNSIQV